LWIISPESIKKQKVIFMEKKQKVFNMIIVGVGGQGLITMLQVIAQSAMNKGYEVKTSELHGLSQRGGSVSVHIRFGKKVYSPIISAGEANLVIALETQEALNAIPFSNKKTAFLVNKYQSITLGKSVSDTYVKNALLKVTKKSFLLNVKELTEKELGTSVISGTFLLGYAVAKNLISLTEDDIKKGIKKEVKEKYWDINMKAIDFAIHYAQRK